MILHEGINCLVFGADGEITPGYGFGFFYDDIRYLSRWQLYLDGREAQPLGARLSDPNELVSFSTNPKLAQVKRETLGIIRTRILAGGIREEIAITNFGDELARFELSLCFDADFLDVSEVESSYESGEPPRRDEASMRSKPIEDRSGLVLHTDRERITIATRIVFDQQAEAHDRELKFRVEIPPGEHYRLFAEIVPIVAAPYDARAEEGGGKEVEEGRSDLEATRSRREVEARIVGATATLETDHPVLGIAYARAVRDLASLAMTSVERVEAEGRTIAAGVPWYSALFGRDSLTAARLMLLADPDLTLGTLRILGRLQGTQCNEANHEQPGKILHAYRRNLAHGELLRHARYKTLDATPLYLMTACEYVRHQGDFSVIESVWSTLERAVEWMDRFGDFDGDGLLEHDSPSGGGWKDSGDSVRYRDGNLAKPPIALVEIQGYAFRSLSLFADICDHLGRPSVGQPMRLRAERIREQIVSRYWMADRSFFAQALDGDKRCVDSLTSNPGHLLWYRAIPDEYAHKVATMLASDAFFSGWGIRTRARGEGGYNPISYHNGSVWPHENAIIASGLADYGYQREARMIIEGQLKLMSQCAETRPPEVVAGYPAQPWQVPVAYFGANPLQAWASAGIVEMVRSVLGLEVDALARHLRLRPFALEDMSSLAWRGVHIGGVRVDIEVRFEGERKGAVVRGLPEDWKIEGAARSS